MMSSDDGQQSDGAMPAYELTKVPQRICYAQKIKEA